MAQFRADHMKAIIPELKALPDFKVVNPDDVALGKVNDPRMTTRSCKRIGTMDALQSFISSRSLGQRILQKARALHDPKF